VSRERLPLWLSLGFVLTSLLHLALVFEQLPEPVASHFDLGGHPNGYQSKFAFALTTTLLHGMFGLLVWTAPSLIRSTRDEFLNLPNKSYWLAPERKAQTKQRLSHWTSWFCCATVGLLTGTFELVIRANLHDKQLGPQLWILLVSYGSFMLVGGVSVALAFRLRPP